MKVDLGGYYDSVVGAGEGAAAAEAEGYDGWWAPETQIDATIGAAVAATRTRRIDVATGITVAFARNPMTVAVAANDLQTLSEGRFILGLGSQIKPHITRRFSMPWSHPAARMREFIAAVQAIWHSWETGEKLAFEGDFYTHTLMTPAFSPGPNPHGRPPIVLAGVGPRMTAAAGEVADGFVSHSFQTERYLREVTLPALAAGRQAAGLDMGGFDVVLPALAFASDSEEERTGGATMIRSQIGFYGSTPAYRPVLELHGWGELQDELNSMTKDEMWARLNEVIPDEVVRAFAVIGTPEEVVEELRGRFGDIVSRIQVKLGSDLDPDRRGELLETLRAPVSTETGGA